MQRIAIGRGYVPRWAVVLLLLLTSSASPVAAQTAYTWTGGGSNTDFLTADNWTPSGGPPGDIGATANLDVALFGTLGTSVSNTNALDPGYSLGAIATIGASGGTVTVNFNGNGSLQLNGATLASFGNVAAAAQNGRDLTVSTTNMNLSFGTAGNPTTFYADAGRTLTVSAGQINNTGGNLNKEGSGLMILSGTASLANAAINVNAGSFTFGGNMNDLGGINVASGAALQAGLAPGGMLSTSAPIAFANNASLRVLTDGISVTSIQNAQVSKGASDVFQIILGGLNPDEVETFNPNSIVISASSLTGFDANGTYTQISPGHFSVVGDGFTVEAWSLSVVNDNQLRLDSVTVSPVPEPGAILALSAVGLSAVRLVRRRKQSSPHLSIDLS